MTSTPALPTTPSSLEAVLANVRPVAQKVQAGLAYALEYINKQQYPALYDFTTKLAAQFDRAEGHYDRLAAITQEALGALSPERRDVLNGEFRGIRDRLDRNANDAERYLKPLRALAQSHPDVEKLVALCDSAQAFYTTAGNGLETLRALKYEGFKSLTPYKHWYDFLIPKSSKGVLLRGIIGMALAITGYYLWKWYRQRHAAQGLGLPRLERFRG